MTTTDTVPMSAESSPGAERLPGGKYRGMAPECGIIALKVLDRYGNGNKEDVIRALSWIRSHREKYRIRVVNISVGTTCRTKGDQDLLLKSVDDLWDEGLNIVAAAGNLGPAPGSVTAPGSSKKVITVGSSDMLEGRTGVSGRGPTAECVCKPDIVAPGNRITSCVPGYPCTYGQKSGTSMSTPLISGAIACMLEKNPDLSNLEIKKRLMDSAEDLGFPQNQQGWGQFDCQRFFYL